MQDAPHDEVVPVDAGRLDDSALGYGVSDGWDAKIVPAKWGDSSGALR